MLTAEQLKPHLLHSDRFVREAVAKYMEDGCCRDPDLLPLVFQACRRDGVRPTSLILAYAQGFTQTETSFPNLLALLATTTDERGSNHLNSILERTPAVLLATFWDLVRTNPNVKREVLPALERRIALASWSAERLWEELQTFARTADEEEDPDTIDSGYSEALIDALATTEVPDADTLCTMLADPAVDGGWLEIALIQLAGLRQLGDAVSILVDKLHNEEDYLPEYAVEALVRIGHPLAIQLVREVWPSAEWDFRFAAAGLLGSYKHPQCEETILALLEFEEDGEFRAMLCESLCDLFSERGVEIVLREIRAGGSDGLDDLKYAVLPVLTVFGIDVPQAASWRRAREAEERRMEKELARLEKEGLSRDRLPPQPRHEPISQRDYVEPIHTPFQHEGPRVGRNDPCPCGSGKKFKKCCGKQ